MVIEMMNNSPLHIAIAALIDLNELLTENTDMMNAAECVAIINTTLMEPEIEDIAREVELALNISEPPADNIILFPVARTNIATAEKRE